MKRDFNGRWKQKKNEDFPGYYDWECPECKFIYSPLTDYQPFEEQYNYCPRCGAHLIKDDDDEV